MPGRRSDQLEGGVGRKRSGSRCPFKILLAVLILHVVARDCQLELGSVVLDVVVERKRFAHLLADQYSSFERPSSSNIANGVSTTTENDQRDVESFDERDARCVT